MFLQEWMQIPRATTVLLMAALMLAGTLGESLKPTASKRRFTRTLDCLQNFIGLLTTVHFFSVLTRFATYFGVIQSDWHVSPPLCIFWWELDQRLGVRARFIPCLSCGR